MLQKAVVYTKRIFGKCMHIMPTSNKAISNTKMVQQQHVQVICILETYKTFVRNTTRYSGEGWEGGEWRLSCDVRRPGTPREIKGVKWLRNGEDISDKVGFISVENDLSIEVGF